MNLKNAPKGPFSTPFQRRDEKRLFANSEFWRQPQFTKRPRSVRPGDTPSAAIDAHVTLEQTLQFDLVAKTLDQPHPAEVGEVAFLEGKMDRTGSFGHSSQNTLTVTFARRPYSSPHASAFRSPGFPRTGIFLTRTVGGPTRSRWTGAWACPRTKAGERAARRVRRP